LRPCAVSAPSFENVERAAQTSDRVTIDFIGKLDGVPFEGGASNNQTIVLGGGNMLADFEAAIVGMLAGETKSFDITFPESYHGKEIAGKQVTFTLTLNRVEQPIIPKSMPNL